MSKLGWLIAGLVTLHAGCGDDDNNLDAQVVIDAAPGTAFAVTLTTAMEVPVCASAGAAATGTTTVRLSQDETIVAVEQLTFSGLSSPVTAANFDAGAPGVAGPIIFSLGPTLTPPISKSFTAANFPSPPPTGGPADFNAFITQLKAGNTYITVKTELCPTGEIRGQVR